MKNHMYKPASSARISMAVCLLAGSLLFASCHHGDKIPDVSGIDVKTVEIQRFDTAFFALDSNNIPAGLYRLVQEYPWFTPDFVSNILGAGPLNDTNTLALQATRGFLVSYRHLKDSLEMKYPDLSPLAKDLTRAFRFFKYYFPKYTLPPKVVAYIGPIDGPGVAITTYSLAIGLQAYGGRNFSPYLSGQGQDMYPGYISRRFEPEYIVPNCMTALAQDLFPDSSENRPLIEQMVIKGKYWWLAGKLLPGTPDSLRTGFTAAQLKWCADNERSIYNFFLQNTDLYTIDPEIIKNYIGDAPKTQGMPDVAPGNIGSWVGWHIVQKYVEDHSDITPMALMRTSARQIFDEAKYKPR